MELESGDESSNKSCFARRQPGCRDGGRDVFVLTGALAKALDPQHYCETGFSRLIDCTLPLVIENHRLFDPDIHHPFERDKHHPVGLA
jgi:hypothetical protein